MALTKVIGAGLGAVTQDGAASFNEGSADVDFRVESNGQTHMLFVDGGNNSVGLGSSNPDSGRKLHIEGNDNTVGITLKDTAGTQFGINSDGNALSIKSDSTATTFMTMDSAGHVTLPKQPSFLARPSSTQENVAINGNTLVQFGTEVFDRGADFSSSTFTAPIEGLYQLSVTIYLQSLDHDTSYYGIDFDTSNRDYYAITSMSGYDADVAYFSFHISVLADMDANDTARAFISIPNSGAAQADISTASHFSGYLVC